MNIHRLAGFAVAVGAGGEHRVVVGLTAFHIRKETLVVQRHTLSCCPKVVHSHGHVVDGVVGGVPAEGNHITEAFV